MAMVGHAAEAVELPVAPGRLHRISHEVYREMARLGLITKEDRAVLIEGLVVTKMTKGPAHIRVVENLIEILGDFRLAGHRVRKEDPIVLRGCGPEGRDSEPEPDVVLARGTKATFRDRLPEAAEVALIIEVADTSLAEDRKMLPVYARAGVPIVWIVNLDTETIEVYWDPSADPVDARYRESRFAVAGEDLEIVDGDTHQVLGSIAVAAVFV
jgi:Uma2 family endonuclease